MKTITSLLLAFVVLAVVVTPVQAADPQAKITSVTLSADFVTIRGELPPCSQVYYTVRITRTGGAVTQNITVSTRKIIQCDNQPTFTTKVKRIYGAAVIVNGRRYE